MSFAFLLSVFMSDIFSVWFLHFQCSDSARFDEIVLKEVLFYDFAFWWLCVFDGFDGIWSEAACHLHLCLQVLFQSYFRIGFCSFGALDCVALTNFCRNSWCFSVLLMRVIAGDDGDDWLLCVAAWHLQISFYFLFSSFSWHEYLVSGGSIL